MSDLRRRDFITLLGHIIVELLTTPSVAASCVHPALGRALAGGLGF
jgi:hypothetical protein